MEPRLLWAAHVAGSAATYATIQAAVDAAPAGGTVTVDAGAYAEQVTVAKPLTLRGAQAGVDARANGRPAGTAATESLVSGAVSGKGVHSSAFRLLADGVTIDGFTVAGETNADDTLGAGIVIGPKQSGTQVLNDVVRNNVAGLFLANYSAARPALVQHCYFASNNNDGDNGGRGIYTNGTISGGNLTNVVIDGNTFYKNLGGDGTTGLEAAIAFEAGTPGRQSNIRITNNAFDNNGKAVLFFNATGVTLQGNTVTQSQDQWSGALRFEGNVNAVSIIYNDLHDNPGPAVAVDSKGMPGDNYGFTVNYNNFANNNYAYAVPISVANNFETYDGTFDARFNYWGNASGPSGYGAGVGDAVGGGFMQIGTGKGWALTAGGSLLFNAWATARVTAGVATPPAAPSGLTAAATAAQVALAWTDNAAGDETGFAVQRSGDGGATFATVATTAAGATRYVDSAGLAAGATYAYRVLALNAAGPSAPSAAVTATLAGVAPSPAPTPTPAPVTTYLSDLPWTAASAGWGTVQLNRSIKGNPIALRGTTYAHGIGTHAASTLTYALAGAYASFAADVGIDDEVNGQGSVDFQVIGDGVVLYDSGKLSGGAPAAHVNVSVAGVKVLQLVATNSIAGSIDYDHADWADARLLANATTTVATTPTTPTATPPTPAAATTSLTTLAPTSASVGWGSLQANASVKGTPITLRSTPYATGLGVHASSTIVYALNGRYAALTADVGIDDETNGQGAVRFQVLGDGVLLYDSGVVTGTSAPGHVNVPLAGVQTLTLLALPGVAGTIDYDHADWANPQLTTA